MFIMNNFKYKNKVSLAASLQYLQDQNVNTLLSVLRCAPLTSLFVGSGILNIVHHQMLLVGQEVLLQEVCGPLSHLCCTIVLNGF